MSDREQPTAAKEPAGAKNNRVIATGPADDRLPDRAATMVRPELDTMVGPSIESPRFRSQPARDVRPLVELHIDELVLHGFAPAQRYAIGDAVERELARLFREHGSPLAATGDLEIATVDGLTLELSGFSNSEGIGVQLAKAIYEGLGK